LSLQEPIKSETLLVRKETDIDVAAINEVTIAAFKSVEISGHTEQFINKALRAARALSLSLVAEVEGQLVSWLAISPFLP
jgi:putative acetyltransferase